MENIGKLTSNIEEDILVLVTERVLHSTHQERFVVLAGEVVGERRCGGVVVARDHGGLECNNV